MTYYRKQRMESFKKAMFASRYSDGHLKPLVPQQRGTADPLPAAAPRPLAS